jgi:hypothetical protein
MVAMAEFFFGGMEAAVELRQMFDFLDFTYVGLCYINCCKRSFFAIEKKNLSHGDVKE